MLIWQSFKVGTVDYESLGFAIGGPFWKVTLTRIGVAACAAGCFHEHSGCDLRPG